MVVTRLLQLKPGDISYTSQALTLFVKYGSVDERIEAGKYGWHHPEINARNFPTDQTGEILFKVILVQFNRFQPAMDDPVVGVKELNRIQLRGSNLDELLAFGIRYPNEQKVVALGATIFLNGTSYHPCLTIDAESGRRILTLVSRSSWLVDLYRLLAFGKAA